MTATTKARDAGQTYISGHCGILRHDACRGTYGTHDRPATCHCPCHTAPAVLPEPSAPATGLGAAAGALPDRRTTATTLIALRVLKDTVAEHDQAVRAAAVDGMLVGDRDTAVVPGPDGEPLVVGHVQYANGPGGSVTAAVVDPAALLAWVQQHAPTEVETVTVVRPAFQRALLDAVKRDGAWPDAHGVLHDVPGVERTEASPGRPQLKVVPAKGAAETVRAAWSDGRLDLVALTALPVGGEQ